MSEKRHNDPLISELDSLKGLLEAGDADFPAAEELRMSACKIENRPDNDDDLDDRLEGFIPEDYLVEVEEPTASRPSPASESPTADSKGADDPIPTIEDVVGNAGAGTERTQAAPEEARSGEREIPVLDETVSEEDIRREAPDALGATSREELETIVDLLLERRLNDMRKVLKKELLGELERHAGLEPPP